MLRATLGTTLALLGALGATSAGSLTAHASPADTPAADTFTVPLITENPGPSNQLSLITWSPSTITSLSASMMSGTDDDYDTTLTQNGSSFPDPNDPALNITQWVATIPVGASPSALPLGNYSVNVTATYSDTTTSTDAGAGTFAFLDKPTVTLTAANPVLPYGTTSTALSGTVTLTNPDGSLDTDYTGLSVNITDGGQAPLAILPVSGTGTFSDPAFTPPGGDDSIVAQVAATATTAEGQSTTVNVYTPPVTPALTLNPSSVTETYGKPAAVTGTLMYGSVPVAGQPVWISTEPSGYSPLATGTTSATGSFSVTLPNQATGETLYVGTTATNELLPVDVPLTVNVVHPTVVSGFTASINEDWVVSVSGCLGFPSGDTTQRITHTSGMTLQYRNSPAASWRNLAKINPNERDTACGTGGIKFTGLFEAPGNYEYYRVAYAGTAGATSNAGTTGNAVLAWRYADRIVNLKVSPTTVNAGGKLTVKGTLQYYYSGWHNYRGQTIYIELHPKGTNATWYWLVKVTTNAQGQFSATFKDPVSATWEAVFAGNNSNGVGHLFAASSQVYVRLK